MKKVYGWIAGKPGYKFITTAICLFVVLRPVQAAQYSVFDPQVSHYKIHDGETNTCGPNSETLLYNHMVSAAYYDGEWIALWNAHVNSMESETNNLIYMSTTVGGSLTDWTDAVVAFSDSGQSSNPVDVPYLAGIRQWQPELITVGSELWCFWNITGGGGGANSYSAWFSKKTSSASKWINTKMQFNGNVRPVIDGKTYFVNPAGLPIKMSNGKILVPAVLMEYPSLTNHLFAGICVEADGSSWVLGTPVPTPAPDGYEIAVYEIADGRIMMMMRYAESGGAPSTVMHWAESSDYGQTWSSSDYVGLEMAPAGGSVCEANGRFVANYTDNPDRYGAALFFSRSGDPQSFVPGSCLTGPNYYQIGHPLSVLHSNKLYTVYSQGVQSSSQDYGRHIWMSVSDVPSATNYYIYPRSLQSERPDICEDAVRFDGEQVAPCSAPLSIGNGDLSLGFRVTPRGKGTLIDARSSSPAFLVTLAYEGSDQFGITLDWNGVKYTPSLTFPKGYSSYIGMSIDNGNHIVFCVKNGASGEIDYQTLSMAAQGAVTMASNLKPQFGMAMSSSAVNAYYGLIDDAWVYTRTISTAEQADLAAGTTPSSELFTRLNSDTLETSAFNLKTEEALVDTTYAYNIKRIVGQGSAGIEADAFDFSKGDMVKYDFSYKGNIPASNIILFTLGDAQNPLRVELTSGGLVQVRTASITNTLCTHITNDWNLVSVCAKPDLVDVFCNGGEVVVKDNFNPRAFLGQGYYEQGMSDSPTFLLDINDLSTTVTPFYASSEIYLPFDGTDTGISSLPWKNAGICGQGESPTLVGTLSAPTATIVAGGGVKGDAFDLSSATVLNPANTYLWGNGGSGVTALEASLNGAASLSGSMWIRHPVTPNLSRLFTLGTIQLLLKSTGAISMTIDGANWHDTAAGTIPVGAWKFVAFSYDSEGGTGNLKIFVGDSWTTNLILVGNFTDAAGSLGTNQCLTIGNNILTGSRPYPGKIDEFRFWPNCILSEDDFKTVRDLDLE